jgi:hypothetical protein
VSCVSKFTLDDYAYPNIVYVDNYANSFFYFLKKGGDPVYLHPIERGSGGWFRLIKEQWEWLHPHLSRGERERRKFHLYTSLQGWRSTPHRGVNRGRYHYPFFTPPTFVGWSHPITPFLCGCGFSTLAKVGEMEPFYRLSMG